MNHLVWALLFGLLWGLAPRTAAGDDQDKRITAARVARGPIIDGHLDDPAWRAARADDRFTQNFPDERRPPSQRTELFVVYDDRALFVGVRCHDDHPAEIVEWLTRRDRDTAADKVTVDIDSRHDHTSAYHFDVNVSGVLADGLRFNDADINNDWDGLWTAATSRDAGGWTAEIEIPWRTLRFDGGAPLMGFQVRRHIQRRQEVDEWAYLPRSERGEVSRYGALDGVLGLGPRRLMQLQPFLVGGLLSRQNSTAASDDGVRLVPNLGVDAKLGLTSSLTLDATVNPDFGQVEADQAILNLTTYEVFYPEKRPFFLEGVELFATPIQQFYTRRIGRSPPLGNDGECQAAVDTPLTGRIWGAAKLSGQVVPHLSIAALDAVTAEQTMLVDVSPDCPLLRARRLRQGLPAAQRVLDPLSNFGVLRLRGDWGTSYVGAMVTAVNRFEAAGAGAPGPGDLCPGEDTYVDGGVGGPRRCTHDAYTASVDGRVDSAGATYSLSAQAIASLVSGGRARQLLDGTVVAPGSLGYGLRVTGGKLGGEPFQFALRWESYSPTLELNDAGFLRSANTHYLGANVTLRTTRPVGTLRETTWDAWSWNRLSWAGALIDQGVGTGPWVRFANHWQASFALSWGFDRWDNRETHDGALTRRTGGWSAELWLKSDPRRALTGELNLRAGRVQRGVTSSGDLTLGVRPLPQLDLQVIPRFSYTYGSPRWVDLSTDGRTYWFGDQESTSFDVTVRGIYTFTPRLTFQLYAQLFVAGVHYGQWTTSTIEEPTRCAADANPCVRAALPLASFLPSAQAPPLGGLGYDSQSGQLNVSAVLRWEYLPGSTLLAVYSRSQAQPDTASDMPAVGTPSVGRFRGGPTVDNLMVKVSYLWR